MERLLIYSTCKNSTLVDYLNIQNVMATYKVLLTAMIALFVFEIVVNKVYLDPHKCDFTFVDLRKIKHNSIRPWWLGGRASAS